MKDWIEAYQERFKDHQLTIEHESDSLKVYLFRNPDSIHLWQRWMFTGHDLVVLGDCYDSIYSGGPFKSIEAAAKCNLSYFSGKCKADRDGWEQSRYDGEVATASIHEIICDKFEHLEIFNEGAEMEDKLLAIEKHVDEEIDTYQTEIPRGFDDYHDTIIWLRENNHFVGDDWWDGLSLNKRNTHPYFHLAALKEAAKQLELKTAAESVAQ